MNTVRIFDTPRRIKLGIWGLGRGLHLSGPCDALNFDVVAGLDFNASMRADFARRFPGALVTDDLDSFLGSDCEAVLLASFFPNHADDAIRCLEAGKHVLSEVTAFMTIADAVRLIETVEKTGLVYQMAENYPYSAPNMWLARKWREGLFGELMYGEYEYVHEVLTLGFTHINGEPIMPGHRVHAWRSWLNFHYYNTHSLGPIMHITQTRPETVAALPGTVRLPGYVVRNARGMGGVTPSLIRMSNGCLVRNLMGATTNDSHIQRLWGTRGSAEQIEGRLLLRLGGHGSAPKCEVRPQLDELGQMAARTGHGGGDFWVLYHFAREILEGVPGPFDVYTSADCTIAGIQAYRSQLQGGSPLPVPDLRDKSQRDRYRDDTFRQDAYDADAGPFGSPNPAPPADRFTTVMRDLIAATNAVCAYRHWSEVASDIADAELLDRLRVEAEAASPALAASREQAEAIIAAYPSSDAARILREVLSRTA
ncbi:MAG: Gfo/Idh/MocA family oxidoreductase [Chthonomonadales bacterium]|nr:Gfo/Idh/MocA family oxidoreductase [Chthonomonadales bacterium]